MVSKNLRLDCARKNNPIFKVYCASATEGTFHRTSKHLCAFTSEHRLGQPLENIHLGFARALENRSA